MFATEVPFAYKITLTLSNSLHTISLWFLSGLHRTIHWTDQLEQIFPSKVNVSNEESEKKSSHIIVQMFFCEIIVILFNKLNFIFYVFYFYQESVESSSWSGTVAISVVTYMREVTLCMVTKIPRLCPSFSSCQPN